MAEFTWPWQYNFPPFFTLQPNTETRNKQLTAWSQLVVNYCRSKKVYTLDVVEAQNSVLFHNKDIDRKLTIDFIRTILDELLKKGHVEWKDAEKKQCLVMWRTPHEWGKQIYSYVCSHGMQNMVCTLFELAEADDSADEEFHGLEKWLLIRSLKSLESEGKCELMIYDDNEGVKFF